MEVEALMLVSEVTELMRTLYVRVPVDVGV